MSGEKLAREIKMTALKGGRRWDISALKSIKNEADPLEFRQAMEILIKEINENLAAALLLQLN